MAEKKKMSKGIKVTIIVTAIIVAIIVLALLLINPIKSAINSLVPNTDEIEDGYVMYNASRYFCRINYPEEWVVSSQDFGFLLNDDTGLLFTLTPATRTYVETDDETTDSSEIAYTVETDDSLTISVYYFSIDQSSELTIYQAYDKFVESFAKEYGIDTSLVGSYSPVITDNNEFLKSSYSFYVTEEIESEDGEETEPVQILCDGNIYVAVRGMAYYGIVVNAKGSDKYNRDPLKDYKTEIDTIINSFRFSVFSY